MSIQSQAAELAAQIEAGLTGDAAALEQLEASAHDTAVAATALGLPGTCLVGGYALFFVPPRFVARRTITKYG